VIAPVEPMRVTVARIAAKHGIRPCDILGRELAQKYAAPRAEAYIACKPGRTLHQVARFFGRDHSTIHQCIKKHADRVLA
jgi:chromosomal replication initiation ATPase DnaA